MRQFVALVASSGRATVRAQPAEVVMFRSFGIAALIVTSAACGTDDPAATVADDFVIPLVKLSRDGELAAALIEANPSPPAKGSNTWTVELTDADGNPVVDQDVSAVLFMPEHGHGSSPTTVTPGANPGEYDISRITFTMGGVWEVRLISEGEATDRDVLFYVDVAD